MSPEVQKKKIKFCATSILPLSLMGPSSTSCTLLTHPSPGTSTSGYEPAGLLEAYLDLFMQYYSLDLSAIHLQTHSESSPGQFLLWAILWLSWS